MSYIKIKLSSMDLDSLLAQVQAYRAEQNIGALKKSQYLYLLTWREYKRIKAGSGGQARSEIRKEKISGDVSLGGRILLSKATFPSEVLDGPAVAESLIRLKARAQADKIEKVWEGVFRNIIAELERLPDGNEIVAWNKPDNLGVIVRNSLEQYGFDPERIDQESKSIASRLTGIIQSVIDQGSGAGVALADSENNVQIDERLFTPEVKFLLSRPDILEKAIEEMGKASYEGYLIDAALTGEERGDFKELAKRFKLAFSYDSDIPRFSSLARDLVKLLLSATAIAYNSSRPLNHMSVKRALGSYAALLDTRTRIGNLPVEQVVVTSESLIRQAVPLVGGWRPLLHVAELLLTQGEGQQGPRILDEKAFLGLLQALTQTRAARQAFAQSA